MYLEIRKKYFQHLLDFCSSKESEKKFVMLSGGVDSFVLLCALIKLFPKNRIVAIASKGMNTYDFIKAKEAADFFGVDFIVKNVHINDFLEWAHLSRGTSDTSVFQSMFRVSAYLLLKDIDIVDQLVYQGDGADSLYGNSSHFAYIESKKVAKDHNISTYEAREMLRRQFRAKSMTGKYASDTATLTRQIIESFGGCAMQPWDSNEFDYVMDVPLSEFKGNTKKWVKDGLVEEWNIDRKLVWSRRRMNMQQGLGLYDLLCKEICKTYGTKTANEAIKKIASGAI